MLAISVKNFGPIAEGSVDLKPLTIFMGPNNTGKSYMATLVYALLGVFGQSASGGKGMPDKTSALDSELTRLFGPMRSLARGGNGANTLRIGLERPEPESSVSYELPPGSSVLRRKATESAPGWTAEGLPSACYYLPSARSWIAGAGKSAPPPGVGADFAGHWRQLMAGERRSAPDKEPVARIAEYLEESILRGGVVEVQLPGVPPPGEGLSLPLHRASAAVSELAPLILFLKYIVNPGDLLILEEPESHLHPAAQLQMARGIARLVNAGLKVIITTHSGDFTGQINNLLRMSNSNEKTSRSLGLEHEDCLSPEQVSAYGFRFDSGLGGAVNYPLPVGSDVGIEDEEFLPVAELLYHQALDLEDTRLT